jgi:uncharacterized membrane protein YdjX (TVP38/TMEM64 family)
LNGLSPISKFRVTAVNDSEEESTGLVNSEESEDGSGKSLLFFPVALTAIAAVWLVQTGRVPGDGVDFTVLFNDAVDKIRDMGPLGYIYFATFYVFAEVLAVPAIPLTASSGYLFGLVPGTITVLISATIAAAISFYIGRTFLRSRIEKMVEGNKKWAAIDRAINKEGLKVVLLLRLSPLLPFALSNYLYGLTSVDFSKFLLGTFLGFAPGTFGFVYAGSAGRDIFSGLDSKQGVPYYTYALAATTILIGAQLIGSIASAAVNELEDSAEPEKEWEEKEGGW